MKRLVSIRLSLVLLTCAASPLAAQLPSGPAAERLQQGLCGAVLPPEQAVILGSVRDANYQPRAGVRVAAMWTEAVIRTDKSETLLRASVDSTAADGTFSLCGVPRETRVTLRADGEDEERSGELLVNTGSSAALERELVIGPPNPGATVTGRLVTAEGAPLVGTIDAPGEAIVPVSTDASGVFRVERLPRRTGQIRIRVLGYLPHFVDLAPDGPLVELGDVAMPDRVQELDAVRIEAAFAEREAREFAERRASLNGVFLDDELLERLPWRSFNNLRTSSTILRGSSSRNGEEFRLRQGAGECYPLVFINGVNAGRQGPAPGSRIPGGLPANEMTGLLQRAKRIEFYLAQFAPPEFADFEGCGAMVIWLR